MERRCWYVQLGKMNFKKQFTRPEAASGLAWIIRL